MRKSKIKKLKKKIKEQEKLIDEWDKRVSSLDDDIYEVIINPNSLRSLSIRISMYSRRIFIDSSDSYNKEIDNHGLSSGEPMVATKGIRGYINDISKARKRVLFSGENNK